MNNGRRRSGNVQHALLPPGPRRRGGARTVRSGPAAHPHPYVQELRLRGHRGGPLDRRPVDRGLAVQRHGDPRARGDIGSCVRRWTEADARSGGTAHARGASVNIASPAVAQRRPAARTSRPTAMRLSETRLLATLQSRPYFVASYSAARGRIDTAGSARIVQPFETRQRFAATVRAAVLEQLRLSHPHVRVSEFQGVWRLEPGDGRPVHRVRALLRAAGRREAVPGRPGRRGDHECTGRAGGPGTGGRQGTGGARAPAAPTPAKAAGSGAASRLPWGGTRLPGRDSPGPRPSSSHQGRRGR